ncbi:hypothetical protein MRX96_024050 [Rhipicephalus microplus]
MGLTRSILITFGQATVPRKIVYGGGLHLCTPYTPRVETCSNCRTIGHRTDEGVDHSLRGASTKRSEPHAGQRKGQSKSSDQPTWADKLKTPNGTRPPATNTPPAPDPRDQELRALRVEHWQAVLTAVAAVGPPLFLSHLLWSSSRARQVPYFPAQRKASHNPASSGRKKMGGLASTVPGLRETRSDGSLVLPAFGPNQFRPEVHSATYRCVASNTVGLVKSRLAHVRGVVLEKFVASVYDVYVVQGNSALLRCHVPPNSQGLRQSDVMGTRRRRHHWHTRRNG